MAIVVHHGLSPEGLKGDKRTLSPEGTGAHVHCDDAIRTHAERLKRAEALRPGAGSAGAPIMARARAEGLRLRAAPRSQDP